METVHVFVSTGRFRSFKTMRAYIDKTYNDDGEGVPSAFIIKVGLSRYEPGCIEAITAKTGRPISLAELLAGASYSEQWLPAVKNSQLADAAICVFAPNQVATPDQCSLEYLGAFAYRAGTR